MRLLVLAVACIGVPAASKSIVNFTADVRQRNVVRLSREACGECATMDEFYEANPMAFVLFYERALMQVHHYKDAIIRGFHDTCKELRFSLVTCGIVDMVDEREYALPYIDPSTAPAHIVVQSGQPLPAQQHHIDRLMKKPGDKETMLWHIRDLFAPRPLEISVEVEGKKAFKRLLDKHDVVIAVALGNAKDGPARQAFRAAARRLVVLSEVSLYTSSPTAKKGSKKWKRELERGRVVFVLARSGDALKGHDVPEGSAAVFHRGAVVRGITPRDVRGAASNDESMAELLKAMFTGLKEFVVRASQRAADEGSAEL